MVDLVKIRKKKAETRAQKAEVADVAAAPPAAPPVVEEPRNPATRQPLPEKLERFKEAAGKKKAGFVHEAAQATTTTEVEVLTFALAGEHYAVHIDHIIEIVTPRLATRVPNADRSVVGIISLRGPDRHAGRCPGQASPPARGGRRTPHHRRGAQRRDAGVRSRSGSARGQTRRGDRRAPPRRAQQRADRRHPRSFPARRLVDDPP
jgi:hypothetical protein